MVKGLLRSVITRVGVINKIRQHEVHLQIYCNRIKVIVFLAFFYEK